MLHAGHARAGQRRSDPRAARAQPAVRAPETRHRPAEVRQPSRRRRGRDVRRIPRAPPVARRAHLHALDGGQRIAVRWRDGAGKSTIVRACLLRFARPRRPSVSASHDVRQLWRSTELRAPHRGGRARTRTSSTARWRTTSASAGPTRRRRQLEAAAARRNASTTSSPALPQGYQHRRRRARPQALRRTAPAPRHRAGAPEGRADPGPRRGAVLRRRRERGRHPGSARPAHRRPHDAGLRPPPLQRHRRRPHPGPAGRGASWKQAATPSDRAPRRLPPPDGRAGDGGRGRPDNADRPVPARRGERDGGLGRGHGRPPDRRRRRARGGHRLAPGPAHPRRHGDGLPRAAPDDLLAGSGASSR